MLQASEAHALSKAAGEREDAKRQALQLEKAEQEIRAAVARGEYSCRLVGIDFNHDAFICALESAGYKTRFAPKRGKREAFWRIWWSHAHD